jgi:rhomboid protease GluP
MWTILGVTVLLFGLQLLTKYLTKYDLPLIYLAKINKAILDGQFWRFITPAFVHASISHIAFNMIALYSFGRSLEGRLGHFRFLVLYLLAAFAGNVMSFWFTAANSVGASTAVFGLLAAENIFVYQNRKYFGTFARRVFLNTALVAAVNLLIGLTPGIDNWGHLGGLLGGAVLTETIFNWPGMGRFAASAVLGFDFNSVMGFTIVVAIIYVLANLIVDVLYAVVDPRVRLGGG